MGTFFLKNQELMILKRVVSLSSCDPVLLVQDFFSTSFWWLLLGRGCCVCMLGCVWLFWDPMDCSLPGSSVHGILQARESCGILSWQWSGLLFPTPGDLPDAGIQPRSPGSPALAGGFFTTESSGKPFLGRETCIISHRPAVVAAELGPVSCKKLVDEELSMRMLQRHF